MFHTIAKIYNDFTINHNLRNLSNSIRDDKKTEFDQLIHKMKEQNLLRSNSGFLLKIAVTEQSNQYYLKKLLSIGLDPDQTDKEGISPLHLAVETGSIDSVKILLEWKADPNIADHRGVTPLHIAYSFDGMTEIIEYLLSKGANPNLRDKLGKRYLM
jgi:ankyrin repeat protein